MRAKGVDARAIVGNGPATGAGEGACKTMIRVLPTPGDTAVEVGVRVTDGAAVMKMVELKVGSVVEDCVCMGAIALGEVEQLTPISISKIKLEGRSIETPLLRKNNLRV